MKFLAFIFIFAGVTVSVLSFGKEARVLRLSEKNVETVHIHPGFTTVLSFPMKPTKVLVGNRGLFGVEFINNDVAISCLAGSAESNLFVYLENRRFAFDLISKPGTSDEIILVRDSLEDAVRVKVK